ncbi:MAG: YbaB/EbfC family nucleoid-associated protein [Candidatus Omnitrophica bacterium]|nr:YbaB/EbfC family nucleoid-associated protein [Candidatus Omnitrophota bacterium]
MLNKMKNMFEAQKKMKEIQRGLENISVDFEGAGGKIKLSMSGTQKVLSMEIDESILSADNKQMLQREIVSSINSAASKVQKAAAEQLKFAMGDLKIPGL